MKKLKNICHVSELKEGDIKLFHLKDIEWVVTLRNGKYYSFENRCPHKGANLAFGVIENGVITCPLHAWKFNLDTGKTADEFISSELIILPVQIKENAIWVEEPNL